MGPAEYLVLLGGGLLLTLLGLIAIFLPRVLAYPIALATLWVAAGLIIHAWKLWLAGRHQ
jgi:hypothetical protein